MPDRGIGYGVLRYLSDGNCAAKLRESASSEVLFRHLGEFDYRPASPSTVARLHQGSCDVLRRPRAMRSYLLQLETLIADGRLHMEWHYKANLHKRRTIEQLGENLIEELNNLIRHCTTPGVGGYTPSDFMEAGLTQQELDQLVAELS